MSQEIDALKQRFAAQGIAGSYCTECSKNWPPKSCMVYVDRNGGESARIEYEVGAHREGTIYPLCSRKKY
ncbi:MAG: hypothetical protein U0525_04565 [Patescibacteria group bacterium]